MSLFAEIVFQSELEGMHLFPLRANEKTPATEHGQDDATTDPKVIAEWMNRYPNGNVGIHCAPSGLYVIDVDSGEGKVGGASWDALVAEHGHVDTFTVRTRSGGLHFYYRMPPGDVLTNTSGKLGRHIDTRGNGYVVAPGSVVGGSPYVVVNDAPIAELPQWVADAVRRVKRIAGRPSALSYRPADPTEVESRVCALAEQLSMEAEGSGNDTANKVAFMVGQYVGAGQMDHSLAQAILEDSVSGWTFRDRDSERSLYATIARALADGTMNPRAWEASRGSAPADADLDLDAEDATESDEEADGAPADEKPKPPPSDWASDGGQARWIIGKSPVLKHVASIGWIKWDGKRWAPITDDQVGQSLAMFYKREFSAAATKWGENPGDDGLRSRAQFLAKQQGTSRIRAIREALKYEVTLGDAVEMLDANAELINTPDGVVNLRTGEVGPHDPSLLMTKITVGSYRPGYRHDDWEAAKSALPTESLDWLQRRMGAAITGSTSVADDAVFLHGSGSNGKSAFLNDGVVRALGDYGSIQSSELIGQTRADAGAATPDKAELRGARLVLIEELPTEFALNTKAIKELSGTGRVRARQLYQDSMVFDATHSLFINTNFQPNVTDTDWGTWRRLTIVPFPFTFAVNPSGAHERRGDRGLIQRIRGNVSGQHDAIVTWLVEGAMAFLADPDSIAIGKSAADDPRPGAIGEASRRWRRDSDRLMAYAEECLEVSTSSDTVARTDLVWHFNQWLEAQGASKWSARLVSTRMAEHPTLGRVEERFQRADDSMTRPPSSGPWSGEPPTLPARFRVLTGLRFATRSASCTCPHAMSGHHLNDCQQS